MTRLLAVIILAVGVSVIIDGCNGGSASREKNHTTAGGHPDELKDSTRLDAAASSESQSNGELPAAPSPDTTTPR